MEQNVLMAFGVIDMVESVEEKVVWGLGWGNAIRENVCV